MIWNVGFVEGETLWNSQSKDEKQQPIQARCVASFRIEPRLQRWFHTKSQYLYLDQLALSEREDL